MGDIQIDAYPDYAAERLIGWNRTAELAIASFEVVTAHRFDDADVLGIDWRLANDKSEAGIFMAHIGFKNFVNGFPHYDFEPEVHVTNKLKELHTFVSPILGYQGYNLRERRVLLPREGFPVMSLFRIEKSTVR